MCVHNLNHRNKGFACVKFKEKKVCLCECVHGLKKDTRLASMDVHIRYYVPCQIYCYFKTK